ncbi:hypothetical protein [Chryseobacterium angstadtii]|uniref:hypothetical protein n=1 Tax=Chryseobacterium angstadtii TaxID=558151 RepID=UPI001F4CCFD7
MDVKVEDIKEEKSGNTVNFTDSSTNSGTAILNNHYNIPDYILENQQEYITLLKQQIEELKKENKKLKSGK